MNLDDAKWFVGMFPQYGFRADSDGRIWATPTNFIEVSPDRLLNALLDALEERGCNVVIERRYVEMEGPLQGLHRKATIAYYPCLEHPTRIEALISAARTAGVEP